MRTPVSAAALLVAALALTACGDSSGPRGLTSGGTPPSTDGLPVLKLLSNRADLLSGGDAYVEIELPAGVRLEDLRIDDDGRDLTSAFALRPNGKVQGIVTGLANGSNLLRVRTPAGTGTKLTLTNHPRGGPVFAGPQIQPWLCGTAANGLGVALDAQCNAPSVFSLQYRSVAGMFAAYNPASPPADVAMTTTTAGKTVPYIVRVEKGALDRGIYEISQLFDPAAPIDQPWSPQPGWNGRVMWLFGGGTSPHHTQDNAPTSLDDNALSNGFMVITQGLNVHGSNSNDNVSAEAVMMAKEHIIEHYGPITSTIGEGCSGGGVQQHVIANSYPGLLDGILPTCSYPDLFSPAAEVLDCSLLYAYFNQSPLFALPVQQALVQGHSSIGPCLAWQQLFASRLQPDTDQCNLPTALVYNAATNPNGARCTITDYQIAVLGPRKASVWGPVETRISRGFANRPLGNVGVQYGLIAFKQGLITAAQFVDLNFKVGSIDVDGRAQAARSLPDPGSVPLSWRAGLVNDARFLARIPIIDLRGHDDAEIHTDDWSHVVRARLDKTHGGHGNHVIFTGLIPLAGDAAFACSAGLSAGLGDQPVPSTPQGACTANPLLLMNRWIDAIKADSAPGSEAEKVLRNKPAEAVDTVFRNGVAETTLPPCSALFLAPAAPAADCAPDVTYYSSPRDVAGLPFTRDVLQCQLKPIDRMDYLPSTVTDAELAQLAAVFTTGVCDYTKPDADAQPSLPWLDYSAGPGGQPLPAAPVVQPL